MVQDRSQGAARMTDIGRRAGVSVSTVSRALMGSPRVAPATRERIQVAAAELGYTLNQLARSLRTQRTWLVVVMVPDIGNAFFSYVLAGIEEEAQRLGYSVLIGNVAGDPRRAKSYGDRLLAGAADGVILLNGQLPEPDWADRMLANSLPVVALCERIPGQALPTVAIDDRAAMSEVVDYLAGAGHRRIAHVAGPPGNVLALDRQAGYEAAMAAHGLERPVTVAGDFTIPSGARAFEAIHAACPDVTAICCANDEEAMGVVNAMRARGLSAPGDISVSGFDGLEFGAAFYPPLTSVVQPRLQLGVRAMQLMHREIAGEGTPGTIILPTKLAIRDSTGPVRR